MTSWHAHLKTGSLLQNLAKGARNFVHFLRYNIPRLYQTKMEDPGTYAPTQLWQYFQCYMDSYIYLQVEVREIPTVIGLLTQSPPSVQRATIEKFFVPSAAFSQPFCHVWSFDGSRWLIVMIYRFYKILSPRIDMEIKSIGRLEPSWII